MSHVPMDTGAGGGERGWFLAGMAGLSGLLNALDFLYAGYQGGGPDWGTLCLAAGFLMVTPQLWTRPFRLRRLWPSARRVDVPPSRLDLIGMAGLLLLSAGMLTDLLG